MVEPQIKPRIAIPVPTSGDLEYNRASWGQYATAVESVGGVAVEVPLSSSAAALAGLVADCHGVLLPGSPADVDPAHYGHERIEECAAADESRETVDRQLIEAAYRLRMPLLTICFGTQTLNVWHGGTLVQDLLPMPVNHRAGRSVLVAHGVTIAPQALLGELAASAGTTEVLDYFTIGVNSSHHQAIGAPGEELRVVARCAEDGVIEAVEGAGTTAQDRETRHFVLGVQWHPERTLDSSALSRAIFERLLTEARAYAGRQYATTAA